MEIIKRKLRSEIGKRCNKEEKRRGWGCPWAGREEKGDVASCLLTSHRRNRTLSRDSFLKISIEHLCTTSK